MSEHGSLLHRVRVPLEGHRLLCQVWDSLPRRPADGREVGLVTGVDAAARSIDVARIIDAAVVFPAPGDTAATGHPRPPESSARTSAATFPGWGRASPPAGDG
ncbi:MAG: hypothetical protein ACT4OS_10890 [Acidimicrobiales bacterium]